MLNVDQSTKKQTEGTWTKFGDSKFKVASSSSTKFQRALNRLQAPYRKKIDKGTLDPKISKDLLCEAMADALIVDWKDVVSAEGPVEYSPEVAKRALMNNDDLREFLLEYSQDIQNFRDEEVAEAGKD